MFTLQGKYDKVDVRRRKKKEFPPTVRALGDIEPMNNTEDIVQNTAELDCENLPVLKTQALIATVLEEMRIVDRELI